MDAKNNQMKITESTENAAEAVSVGLSVRSAIAFTL